MESVERMLGLFMSGIGLGLGFAFGSWCFQFVTRVYQNFRLLRR